MSDWAFRQEQAQVDDEPYAPCDGCGYRANSLYDCGDDGDLCARCFDRAADAYFRRHPHLLPREGT